MRAANAGLQLIPQSHKASTSNGAFGGIASAMEALTRQLTSKEGQLQMEDARLQVIILRFRWFQGFQDPALHHLRAAAHGQHSSLRSCLSALHASRSLHMAFMQAAHTTRVVDQGAARAAEALNASLMAEVAELRLGNDALREQVIHQSI